MSVATRLNLSHRVFFHPFVPHSELGELLVDANVAIGLYAPFDVNNRTPSPNKVFESMAYGLPVVVTAGNSIADDVIAAHAGLAVALGSREALADALRRLLDDGPFAERCRASARNAHLREFNYETQLQNTLLGSLFPVVQATP